MRAERTNKDVTFMQMALALSRRSTCARRAVGCILIDEHGHIIGSGYNGNAASLPHCIDEHCAGATCKSGTGLELCEAIHAEQNALMQCKDVNKIVTCYVTTMPCIHCTKMLLNTSCSRVNFLYDYVHSKEVMRIWRNAGRLMLCCVL